MIDDFIYRVQYAKAELEINANIIIELSKDEFKSFISNLNLVVAEGPADVIEILYGGVTVRKSDA